MLSKITQANTLPNKESFYHSVTLDDRLLCDLEMIMNGGFHPLRGFMNSVDYQCVLENCRLSNGNLWPIPIVLHITEKDKIAFEKSSEDFITLRDKYYMPIAHLKVEEIYKPNLEKEGECVFGVFDDNHPYIDYMLKEKSDCYYVGGEVFKIQYPVHYNFQELRMTPQECKEMFQKDGWKTIVGFQTRNPMHRSHMELTKYALLETGDENAKLLVHPVVGITQDCDVPYEIRVKCYQKIIKHYPEGQAKLCLLPLSMRMAGPREALWHALIRQNYGCTHFVVGRDHAGPSFKKKNGESFYGAFEAQELLKQYEDELKIKIICSDWIVYVKEKERYMLVNEIPDNCTKLFISGTEQRRLLAEGKNIPEWFTYPSIVEELRKVYLPNIKRGFCVYFIGLSGCGKTTLANILSQRLKEKLTERKITLLDGDVIRLNLSKGLGFNKEDRSTNVRRIGYVASEIVKHNGVVICANIAPYDEDRVHNREKIKNYIEIFVDTPLNVCEMRDVKGLYKLAREGKIKQFTGISDPFETPTNCDLVVDGSSIEKIYENVDKIINKLKEIGYID